MLRPHPRRSVQATRTRRVRPTLEALEGRRLLAVDFFGPTRIATGGTVQGIALADFDGDGTLDLAVAETDFNQVGIALGRGDGSFTTLETMAAGSAPVDLAAADLDGDGRIDLVVTNFYSNNVSVMLGRGDGTFGPRAHYAVGGGPRSVAIVDLDGDGALDLVVGNQGHDVSLLYGLGDGAFAPAVGLGLSDQANGVAIADMNGDGRPDVLVSGYFEVYVYLNQGPAGFPSRSSYRTSGGGGAFVAAGDVNSDGRPDVVQSNTANNFVSIFLNDGPGGLEGPFIYTIGPRPHYLSTGDYPYETALVDLDLDGHLDLLMATNRGLVVRPGAGDGTFNVRLDFSLEDDATYLAVGDIDGDGKPDVVATDYAAGRVLVFRTTEDAPPPSVTFAIEDVSVPEGDLGTTGAVITVRISGPTTVPVSVSYATAGGTAIPGVDYAPVSGVLTIPAGSTTATFVVPVAGNLRVDGTRTVEISLSDPENPATLGDSTAVLTILDDETPDESPSVPIPGDVAGGSGGVVSEEPVGVPPAAAGPPAPPQPEPYTTLRSVAFDLRRGGEVAAIRLAWSADLDPGTARSLSNYRLVLAGRDGRFGTRDDRRVALRSASYDAAGRTVVLVPRSARLGVHPLQLTVSASVTDARGYAVDGDGNGLPGGDSRTILRRGGFPRDTPGSAAVTSDPAVPGSGRPWKPSWMRRPRPEAEG